MGLRPGPQAAVHLFNAVFRSRLYAAHFYPLFSIRAGPDRTGQLLYPRGLEDSSFLCHLEAIAAAGSPALRPGVLSDTQNVGITDNYFVSTGSQNEIYLV
jgi:hypothetical protein